MPEPSGVTATCLCGADVTDACDRPEPLDRVYRHLLANLADGVLYFHRGQLIEANDAAAAMFGYGAPQEMIGLRVGHVLSEGDFHRIGRLTAELERGNRRSLQTTVLALRRDGSTFDCELSISLAPHDDAPVYLVVARDISDQLAAEQALCAERQQAQRYLDVAEVILIALDRDGQVSMVNRKGCEVLGYSADEIVGRDWFECFLPEKDRDKVRAVFARLIRGEVAPCQHAENEVLTSAGVTRRIVWNNTVLRDENGRIIGTLSSGEDVTERRQAEEQAQTQAALLRVALDNSPDSIYFKDRQHRFIAVSAAKARHRGTTPAEMVGKTDFDYAPAEVAQARWDEDERVLTTGEPVVGRVDCVEYPDGSTVWYSVTKVPYRDQSGEIVGMLGISRDITRSIEAEQAARASQALYRAIADNLALGISVLDRELRVIAANPRMQQLAPGLDPSARQKCYQAYRDPSQSEPCAGCPSLLAFADGQAHETTFTDPQDHRRRLRILVSPIRDESGEVTHVVELVEDVTDQRQLEEQLRQAAKSEAIGRLVGGVAHDFNNILSVILTQAELWRIHRGPNPDMEMIEAAAHKAADLTGQLLAYTRKQTVEPRLVNLGVVAQSVAVMLRRVVGEDIELRVLSAPDLWDVRLDPSQAEQIVLNLATNARDAMPGGGTLTIELANVRTEGGDCVQLTVADTGVGMDAATLERVFEPYFTTKELGWGTGLGLSVVHGAVQQAGGTIEVQSRPGEGTRMRVLLPRANQDIVVAEPEQLETSLTGRGEVVLVVEDEENLRSLACRALELAGYRVLSAAGPEEARARFAEVERVDLLFVDVVLRGANGHELAQELLALRPGMRVLYTSGYTDSVIVSHGVLARGLKLLPKPYTPTTLAQKVRAVLG